LLNNIAIRFNKKDFEYDVYSLVKAFYPQAQITMFYEGEEEAEGEYGMFLLVAYGSQEICLSGNEKCAETFGVWCTLSGNRKKASLGRPHRNPADQDSDETSGRRLEKYRDCPVYEGNIWGKQ